MLLSLFSLYHSRHRFSTFFFEKHLNFWSLFLKQNEELEREFGEIVAEEDKLGVPMLVKDFMEMRKDQNEPIHHEDIVSFYVDQKVDAILRLLCHCILSSAIFGLFFDSPLREAPFKALHGRMLQKPKKKRTQLHFPEAV